MVFLLTWPNEYKRCPIRVLLPASTWPITTICSCSLLRPRSCWYWVKTSTLFSRDLKNIRPGNYTTADRDPYRPTKTVTSNSTAHSWPVLIIQWNSCTCVVILFWMTARRTNHCAEHFHLSFTRGCFKNYIHTYIHNFCISKLIVFPITNIQNLRKLLFHKSLIFSELILCASGAYWTRCHSLFPFSVLG